MVYANCKLAGATAIVDAGANITLMESLPVGTSTANVAKPVNGGSNTEMAESVHENAWIGFPDRRS